MRKTLLTLASETAIISGAVFLLLTVPLLFVYPPLFASTELVATFLLRFALIGCVFVAIGGMGILPAVAESATDWSVFQPIPIGQEIARRFSLTSVSACGRMCLESRERTTDNASESPRHPRYHSCYSNRRRLHPERGRRAVGSMAASHQQRHRLEAPGFLFTRRDGTY